MRIVTLPGLPAAEGLRLPCGHVALVVEIGEGRGVCVF